MDQKELSEYMASLGRKGGDTTVKKYGRVFMSEIAKKSAQVRQANKKRREKENAKKQREEERANS